MREETRLYIEQRMRTDKKFALAFVVVFVIWVIFGFMSGWPGFAVFNAAVWGALSLSSTTRLLHSSRILEMESGGDAAGPSAEGRVPGGAAGTPQIRNPKSQIRKEEEEGAAGTPQIRNPKS